MTIEAMTAGDGAAWNRFVESHPAGTMSQVFQWRHVVERAYRKRCVYLAAEVEGEVVGVFPAVVMRRPWGRAGLVSMPYLDEGGILASSATVADALWARACEEIDPTRGTIEVRSPLPFRQDAADPAVSARRFRLLLDLPRSSAELWSAIGGKVRNQIRKSRKEGLTTSRVAATELPSFYEVFARNMRDLGSPVHSYKFLAEVFTQFGDRAWLYLTRAPQGTPVAGGIAIAFRDLVTVPWASSLRSARRACPNHSLYWQVLEDAVAQGAGAFDFGRSTEGTGTFSFKRQWGAKPVPLLWEVYSPQGERQPATSMDPARRARLAGLWSKLPVAMATRLGSLIRGHLAQ